ncbi:MAG: hypothetical protein ACHP7O_11670 [Burkholderiales bacterium]
MARPQKDFFVYPVSFLGLVAGAVASQVLTFDASSDFVWYYGCYTADVAAAGQTQGTRTFPLVNILITPTDTAAQFMQAAIPLTHMFGIGENPFVMPSPRLIPARSAINFQVTNRDAAQTYNLFLSLVGVKQYLA